MSKKKEMINVSSRARAEASRRVVNLRFKEIDAAMFIVTEETRQIRFRVVDQEMKAGEKKRKVDIRQYIPKAGEFVPTIRGVRFDVEYAKDVALRLMRLYENWKRSEMRREKKAKGRD